MRQAVWSVNASLPLALVRTLQEVYDRSLARTTFALVMLAIAGAMALMLGIIGIYLLRDTRVECESPRRAISFWVILRHNTSNTKKASVEVTP